MTLIWFAIIATAWIVVPLPLAMLVGRVFGREDGDFESAPSARGLVSMTAADAEPVRVG